MKKKQHLPWIILLSVLWLIACKKPYDPPEIKIATNFLVIDGSITCGNDAVTTIVLSRTTNLGDSLVFNPELNASVFIEQEQGNTFPVTGQRAGTYQTQSLSLDPTKKYRLKIRTADNKNYVSEYVPGKISPAIDSLSWKQNLDLTVSVFTHDLSKNTRYYRWEYDESWNYRSIFSTDYGVQNGLIFVVDATTQRDSCWRTDSSKNIVVGSSVALSEDVINEFPVAVIPQNDQRIGRRYSILVKQYALTEEAFRYLQLIQKNTQQLGTLFDAQPSQLKGNVQSVENPNEPVIGYISASTVSTKRIFIQNNQLTDWHYAQPVELCGNIVFIAQNPTNYAIWDFPDLSYAPYYFTSGGGIAILKKACLDCTVQGGTNVKPSFW
ncbi:MAG: DUF4249 domain-containing protein [Chitinophagaceae bacterium]